MRKSLQVQDKEVPEDCEQNFTGHSDGSLGDQNAKGKGNKGGPAPEVSGRTKLEVILEKILISFCLCPD